MYKSGLWNEVHRRSLSLTTTLPPLGSLGVRELKKKARLADAGIASRGFQARRRSVRWGEDEND